MDEDRRFDTVAILAERAKLERLRCLTIARDALNQERTGNLEGDYSSALHRQGERIYRNGWKACAEKIIEGIGPE